MTKKEVFKQFREIILPEVHRQYGKGNRIAISEEWCNYTDYLFREGEITEKQNNTWTNPF